MISSARIVPRRSLVKALCGVACALLLAGCSLKQDMALQPKNRPLSPSDFFTDGRSERPLVENTVARGSLANGRAVCSQGFQRFSASRHAGICWNAGKAATRFSARRVTGCRETATAWFRCAA